MRKILEHAARHAVQADVAGGILGCGAIAAGVLLLIASRFQDANAHEHVLLAHALIKAGLGVYALALVLFTVFVLMAIMGRGAWLLGEDAPPHHPHPFVAP